MLLKCCVRWHNIKTTVCNLYYNNYTVHSPRAATRPVTCLGDRWQTYHVLSQHRDTATSRIPASWQHVVDVCPWCCIHVVEDHPVMTSLEGVVTSLTVCEQWICQLMTQSSATWRMTTGRQLILAIYTRVRRRTVDDRRGWRRCQWELSFLWREYQRVDWVCQWMSWWWRTQHRQHRRCHLAVSLPIPRLQHTTCELHNDTLITY